ncbi:MAG: TIGR03545 family protein [Spirochaetales bacterium]|nr:TIGR03545 family protein [Spirochaetales bacterium]
MKRVFIPKDRAWLEKLFKKNDDGLYVLDAADINKEAEKRLKGLAKTIKKNSGLVSRPKVIIAAVLIALICGGYYFFRNIIVEKALVSGLELVFQAKASVSGLDFDIFDAKLEWNSLEVANRRRPMKNLFELGYSEARFSLWNLLKARFVVENLEVQDIRWNTDRTSSGALPEAVEEKKEESSSGGFASEMAGSIMSSLSSFDAKAILESQLDKLATPQTARRIKEELETQTEAWKGRISGAREEVQSLKAQVDEMKGINPQSLKTAEEIAGFVKKVNDSINAVQKAVSSAETLKKDFDATAKKAVAVKTELQQAVQKDYAYAASLVNLGSGGLMSMASGLFSDFAREHLGDWYTYGLLAVEIARNLPKSDDKEKTEEKIPDRKGRIISFPVRDKLPKLWIKNVAFNTEGNREQKVAGKITDITGAPDLIGRPVAFDVSVSLPQKFFGLEGNIDTRRDAKTDADMSLSVQGIPIAVKLPSPVLTIKSLEGPLDTKASMKIFREGGMSGSLAGSVTQPKLEREGAGNSISNMAYSVLSSVRAFDLDVRYALGADKKLDVDISSSLDKSLKDGFTRYIKEQEGVYRARIQEELKKRLDGYIAENEIAQKGMAELQKYVGDNLTDINAYKKALDDKKKELENRATALAKEKAASVLKEAQKKLPSIPKLF